MDKVEINSYEDLFNVLDRINESIDWNTFYEKRVIKAPFLVNNMLPDIGVSRDCMPKTPALQIFCTMKKYRN